jgi:DNA-binding NarL/FixJ family response regulator
MLGVRVLIVDDVAAVREALRLLLGDEPGVDVVGEAADGEDALRQAALLQPDLVLMDLDLPRPGGLAAIRLLRRGPRPPKVIALSVYGADERVRLQALAAGASAYVEKGASLTDVVAALRAALPTSTP